MPKGKAQICTWYCAECGKGEYTTAYNKRNNEAIIKILTRHCSQCRKHTEHKRKDVKKAAK